MKFLVRATLRTEGLVSHWSDVVYANDAAQAEAKVRRLLPSATTVEVS